MEKKLSWGGRGHSGDQAASPAAGKLPSPLELTLLLSVTLPQGIFPCFLSVLLSLN